MAFPHYNSLKKRMRLVQSFMHYDVIFQNNLTSTFKNNFEPQSSIENAIVVSIELF